MIHFFYVAFFLLVSLVSLKFLFQTRRPKNFPPGPPYLPVIGNLHQIKQPLHRTFNGLSQKYGQIFSLVFGSHKVVVVSSLSIVQECFTKNDVTLSDRPKLLIGKYLGYNYTAVGFSPYGDHWRNLRRIISLEVLSSHRLNSSLEIRRDEIMRLIQKLAQDSSKDFAKVELKSKLLELTFNTMMRILTGKRYFGEDLDASDIEEAKEFREIIKELVVFSDFIPAVGFGWLGFDPEKNIKSIGLRFDAFIQRRIDEHRNGKKIINSMIHHLLTLQQSEPQYYTDQIIKGLILDLLIGGTDTSGTTLEWTMSNLLNHPEIIKKARKELDIHIGQDRLVDESDIAKLPYLQNIVRETLRLHPVLPLLVPRSLSKDCIIGGYKLPQNTTLVVNAWAIHTDPNLWTDPLLFKPERFEKEGEANKLLAFGSGRRSCPGANMAQRTMSLTLALLIQCFEWKRTKEELIDMTEGNGMIVVQKKFQLEAMCRVRQLSTIKDIL
ncbi:PREDICTED: cytochrome P450 81E8-like [Lupinus angustifolius]|nr:PREDICTED: cytochrome P450 81E8-like [Lupinus angustifolius]